MLGFSQLAARDYKENQIKEELDNEEILWVRQDEHLEERWMGWRMQGRRAGGWQHMDGDAKGIEHFWLANTRIAQHKQIAKSPN